MSIDSICYGTGKTNFGSHSEESQTIKIEGAPEKFCETCIDKLGVSLHEEESLKRNYNTLYTIPSYESEVLNSWKANAISESWDAVVELLETLPKQLSNKITFQLNGKESAMESFSCKITIDKYQLPEIILPKTPSGEKVLKSISDHFLEKMAPEGFFALKQGILDENEAVIAFQPELKDAFYQDTSKTVPQYVAVADPVKSAASQLFLSVLGGVAPMLDGVLRQREAPSLAGITHSPTSAEEQAVVRNSPLGHGKFKPHQTNNISVLTPSKIKQTVENRGVVGMVNNGLKRMAELSASFHRHTQFPGANGVPIKPGDTTKIWGDTAKHDSRNTKSNLSTSKLKSNFKKYPPQTRSILNRKIKRFTIKNSENIDYIQYIKLHKSVNVDLNKALNKIKQGKIDYKLIKYSLSLIDFSNAVLDEMKSKKQGVYVNNYIHSESHANEKYFLTCFEYNKNHMDKDFIDVVDLSLQSERKGIYDDFHQLDKSFYSELNSRINKNGIDSYENAIDKVYKKMSAKVGHECYKYDTGKTSLNDSDESITKNDFEKNHLAKLYFSEKENYEIYSHIKKIEILPKMPPCDQSVFEARKIAVEVLKIAGYTHVIPNDDNDKITYYRKIATSDQTSEEMKIFLRKTAALSYNMITIGKENQDYIRLTETMYRNFNNIKVDYFDYIYEEEPGNYKSIDSFKPYSECGSLKEYYEQFTEYKKEHINHDAKISACTALIGLGLTDFEIAKMKPKNVYFATFKTQEIPKFGKMNNGKILNNNPFEKTSGSMAFIPLENGSLFVTSDLKGIPAKKIFSENEIYRDGFLRKAYSSTYLEPTEKYRDIDYLIKSLYGEASEFHKDLNGKNIALFNPNNRKEQAHTAGMEMYQVVQDTMRRMLAGWSDHNKQSLKDYGFMDKLLNIIPFLEEYRDSNDPEYKPNANRLTWDTLSVLGVFIQSGEKAIKLGDTALSGFKNAILDGLKKKLSGQLFIQNTLRVLASNPEFTAIGLKGLKQALWLGSEIILPIPSKMITSPIKSIGKSIKKNISIDFIDGKKYNLKETRFTPEMIKKEKEFVSNPIIHKEIFRGAADPMAIGNGAPPPPPRNGVPPQPLQNPLFTKTQNNQPYLKKSLNFNVAADNIQKFEEMKVKAIKTYDEIGNIKISRDTAEAFGKRYQVAKKDGSVPANVATYENGEAYNLKVTAEGSHIPAYDLYVSKNGENIITSSSYKSDDVSSIGKPLSYSDIMFNVLKESGVDLKNIKRSIQASIENKVTQSVIESIGSKVQRGQVITINPTDHRDAFFTLLGTDNCKATAFMLNQYANEFGSKTITSIEFKGTAYLVMNIG